MVIKYSLLILLLRVHRHLNLTFPIKTRIKDDTAVGVSCEKAIGYIGMKTGTTKYIKLGGSQHFLFCTVQNL